MENISQNKFWFSIENLHLMSVYSVLVQDKYGTMILFTSHKRQFSRGKRYLHIFTKIESIIFHTAPYFLYTINNHYTFSYCLTCVIAAFSERQLNGLYLL